MNAISQKTRRRWTCPLLFAGWGMWAALWLLTQPEILPADEPRKQPNHDPDAAEMVTSDIDLFWKAYDQATPKNRIGVLREQYLKKGSVGLSEFTRQRIGNAENLAAEIEKHPKYYASLREPSSKASSSKDAIHTSFRKLKDLYPPAVFPNVYFVVGRMNSGGTATELGLLIGVEMYGKSKDTPEDELGAWHKAVLRPVDDIPRIVAHELIHYQQKYPKGKSKLLGAAIMEGSADFIGEMICGGMINDHLHRFGNPRERELWAEFQREMDGEDLGNWLYNGNRAKDKPADLGYYVGYKICESYYRHSNDKKAAIEGMLNIKDFKDFLKASNYEAKFASQSGG